MTRRVWEKVDVIACPRCGRFGIVGHAPRSPGRVEVRWADPDVGHWRDTAGHRAVMEDPAFGCGHCGAVAEGPPGFGKVVANLKSSGQTE